VRVTVAAIAPKRHIHRSYLTGDTPEGFEHAVMRVGACSAVTDVISIRVVNLHDLDQPFRKTRTTGESSSSPARSRDSVAIPTAVETRAFETKDTRFITQCQSAESVENV
jgi:hypothetical protein